MFGRGVYFDVFSAVYPALASAGRKYDSQYMAHPSQDSGQDRTFKTNNKFMVSFKEL